MKKVVRKDTLSAKITYGDFSKNYSPLLRRGFYLLFYESVSVMNFCFFLSSLNPLSLMKSTRLFRNFIFLFSLLGLGSAAWGERYETLSVQTDNTALMSHADAIVYLKSTNVVSLNSIAIHEGESAYVFSATVKERTNATFEVSNEPKEAFVSVKVSIDGLDANNTFGYFDPISLSGGSLSSSAQPIPGPATIRIFLKPSSKRQSYQSSYDWWNNSSMGNWDFGASEGFVTFRIVGSEQAPSKKFATVIPENASGNVRIVLEQSTDLINWSSANPGVFPPSTSKRFFRVRSVEE